MERTDKVSGYLFLPMDEGNYKMFRYWFLMILGVSYRFNSLPFLVLYRFGQWTATNPFTSTRTDFVEALLGFRTAGKTRATRE